MRSFNRRTSYLPSHKKKRKKNVSILESIELLRNKKSWESVCKCSNITTFCPPLEKSPDKIKGTKIRRQQFGR